MNNIKFMIRQGVKILTRNVILPVCYRLSCVRHRKVNPRLVVFADAHHSAFPDSMEAVRQAVERRGFQVECYVQDYQRDSFLTVTRSMISFMNSYAQAGTVFICDYFLPVTACRKRKATRVVQLWHACGALKKFGYDAEDDIPPYYPPDMFKNYDLVTVSGAECVPFFASAFHLPKKKVEATGVSRTDKYWDASYREACREEFFAAHPDAAGKKLVLWAPTFRGNAAMPELVGAEEILQLQEKWKQECYLLVKLHPHMEDKLDIPHTKWPVERLLPATDVLITDYSSVMFEFSLFQRPILRFVPDDARYLQGRGLYPCEGLPGPACHSVEDLEREWQRILAGTHDMALEIFCRKQMTACDGHATERILTRVGMVQAD